VQADLVLLSHTYAVEHTIVAGAVAFSAKEIDAGVDGGGTASL
jgi:hypothetical protein